jgi:hypothetical protein
MRLRSVASRHRVPFGDSWSTRGRPVYPLVRGVDRFRLPTFVVGYHVSSASRAGAAPAVLVGCRTSEHGRASPAGWREQQTAKPQAARSTTSGLSAASAAGRPAGGRLAAWHRGRRVSRAAARWSRACLRRGRSGPVRQDPSARSGGWAVARAAPPTVNPGKPSRRPWGRKAGLTPRWRARVVAAPRPARSPET